MKFSRYLRRAFLCAIVLWPELVCAATSAASQNEAALQQVRSAIESLRKDIVATQTQHDSVRTELADIERQIGTVHKRIRHLRREQQRQQNKLSELTGKEKSLQQEVAAQRDLLARQIRAAYAIGQQEYLKLWLNAQDPAAVSRTSQYYDYMNRARAQRITQARTSMEKLLAVGASIRVERDSLAQLQQQQETIKQELEVRSRSRTSLMQQLKAQLLSKEQQLQRNLEDEKRLNKLIASLREVIPDILMAPGSRTAFGKLKGKLHWPTQGRVQDTFGKKRESGRKLTNGVLIQAEEGREVRAVSQGRVAYADWLRGYGMLLILDHGDGYMSLYGHNQAIYKELGEWVQSGEVIAAVGKSGGENQSSLYFEIRHNGKPDNPLRWCRR